jgi:hypothetical protein
VTRLGETTILLGALPASPLLGLVLVVGATVTFALLRGRGR